MTNYTVTIQPEGDHIQCADNESVLHAALRQGVLLPYGCRSGYCGSCKAQLVSGQVELEDYDEDALTVAERDAGKTLLCRARPCSDLEIAVREIHRGADLEVRRMPARVARMELLSDDVMQLFLKLPSSERLQFLAGQYIQVIMKNGKRRSFSLANSPSDDEFLELHVRHVPDGAWTDHVFQNMKIKEILRIEGPFGEFFWRDESTGPAIFVAGGTGFAPVKSILEALFERQVQQALYLYWGVRRQRDLYMLDTVEQWARRYRNFQFIPVLSEAGADADWKGRRGWVHEAVLEDFVELSRCAVYAAGPPVMVQAAQRAFPGRGLLPERFYSDAFTYARD